MTERTVDLDPMNPLSWLALYFVVSALLALACGLLDVAATSTIAVVLAWPLSFVCVVLLAAAGPFIGLHYLGWRLRRSVSRIRNRSESRR